MNRLCDRLYGLMWEEEATTVSEYAVMLGLIVLTAVGAISGIGNSIGGTFAALDAGVIAASAP